MGIRDFPARGRGGALALLRQSKPTPHSLDLQKTNPHWQVVWHNLGLGIGSSCARSNPIESEDKV
jgi:hypothetical protein